MSFKVRRQVKFYNLCSLLLLCLSITGCSNLFLSKALPELPLLPPVEFGKNVQISQRVSITPERISEASSKLVSGRFTDGSTRDSSGSSSGNSSDSSHDVAKQTLLAAWVVNSHNVSLVGLSSTGQRLMTLTYDGNVFTENYSVLLEEEIPGRAVMSYMQLAHWPEKSIRHAFTNTQWTINFLPSKRTLYYKKHPVLEIIFDDEKNNQVLEVGDSLQIISGVMPLMLDVKTLSVTNTESP